MFRRYSFLLLFFLLLGVLGWWSKQVDSSAHQGLSSERKSGIFVETRASSQRELIETLDRIIFYERYYHSVYGHFTRLLNRVGVSIPRIVSEQFEIRVAESSKERLLLTAFSEVNGKTTDIVTIDQDFQLRASFPIPSPRSEYLKIHAMKQLRALRDASEGQTIEEQGLFKGYFQYEVRRDSQDRKMTFALGIKSPVKGMELELGPSGSEFQESGDPERLLSDFIEEEEAPARTGQTSSKSSPGSAHLEQTYLAQRIFYGEIGRYAKSWSELSRIANFRFDTDKDQFGGEKVPFGAADSVLEIDAAESDPMNTEKSVRTPAVAESGNLDGSLLEIEPLGPDEVK